MKTILTRSKASFVILSITILFSSLFSFPVFASAQTPNCSYNENELRKEYVSYTGAEVYKVDGKKFCTLTLGQGDNVIFFLPGLGLTAPIIDLKPFASALADKGYKVVIVEPLGTGMSDITNKERTVENITKELHGLINKMGYKKYSIMAHSIGGAYSLYYANKYPKEIKSFISLDSSAPAQIENKLLMQAEKMSFDSLKDLIASGQEISPDYYLSSIYGYSYTDEEKDFIKEIFLNRQINASLIGEYDELENNLVKISQLKYPCKYLGFISEQNLIVYPAAFEAKTIDELMELIPQKLAEYVPSPSIRDLTSDDLANPKGWAAIHLDTYNTNDPANKTYVVPSNHYVHYSQEWPNMITIIDNWYKQNVK